MNGEYYVAFDLAATGYTTWTSLWPGLIIFVVGLICACFPGALPFTWPWSRAGIQVGGWLIATLSGALTAFALWVSYDEYRDLAERLATGRYQIVEGAVENYARDRTYEKFSVNGVWFEYSDFRGTSAFNNTAAEGGPVRPGQYVRIAHADGKILRLELRR